MAEDADSKRVLVTGVGGFIGGFLARDLASRGYEVIGTARSRQGVPLSVVSSCRELHAVSIGGATDWTTLLAGVRAVVHCAAHVHIARPSRHDQRLFQEVNVEGARRLAEACRGKKVELLINLSSIAARAVELGPERAGYGHSKAEGEQAIERALAGSLSRHVCLRLPAVYGPGCKGSLGLLFRLLGSGLPLPIVTGAAKRSYLSVWNLADCVEHCLLKPPSHSCTVAVADPTTLDLEELVLTIAQARGRRQPLLRVRRTTLAVLARLIGRGRQFERGFRADVVDPAEAMVALGWQPSLSAAECWARVVAAR